MSTMTFLLLSSIPVLQLIVAPPAPIRFLLLLQPLQLFSPPHPPEEVHSGPEGGDDGGDDGRDIGVCHLDVLGSVSSHFRQAFASTAQKIIFDSLDGLSRCIEL